MRDLASNAKLLILGMSGFIGSNLGRVMEPGSFVGTYLTRPIRGGVFLDIARERLADKVLRRGHGFTHAVLAQGVTKLEQCVRMRADSAETNVTGTLRAIEDLLDAGVHPIFLSSDAVFDGSPGLRSETDEPRPILSYGCDKLEVERYFVSQECPWTVLRLTKVIAGFNDRRNLLSQWLADIEHGQSIRCATDQVLAPVDVDFVIRAILFFIGTSTQGIFHISGSELVTRIELLQCLLEHAPRRFRQRVEVKPCSIDEFAVLEPLPHNCALSNTKFVAASGIMPRSLDEVCAELCGCVFSEYDYTLELGA